MRWFSKSRQDDDLSMSNTEYVSNKPLIFEPTEFQPKKYEEVEHIAQQLLLRRPVKIDLVELEKSERKRMMDFISGMIFVLDLEILKVNQNCYELKFPAN